MNLLEKQLQDKGMPFNVEHEMAVNSILIASKAMLEQLTEKGIDKSYFYTSIQQRIYLACCAIIDEGKNIDILQVKQKLKEIPDIQDILTELEDYGILEFTWDTHIEGLIEYKQRREQVLKSIDLFKNAYNGSFKVATRKCDVKEYVLQATGEFNIATLDREVNLRSKQEKSNRSTIICRLVKDGVIERVGKRTGNYRKIAIEENIINWQDTSTNDIYDLKMPFRITEDLVNIYPGNLIIIAGVPNAGKSAFLFNIIRQNMDTKDVVYYSSEMAGQELKVRLSKFKDVEKWNFKAIERSSDFADIVGKHPDSLNIIDFLEIPADQLYMIGTILKNIADKLDKGIAIVAIQKKKNQEYGRGQEFSLERCRLYLSIDPGELKIVKAKNFKSSHHNPNGDTFDFKLVNGCEFQQTNLIESPLSWDKRNR